MKPSKNLGAAMDTHRKEVREAVWYASFAAEEGKAISTKMLDCITDVFFREGRVFQMDQWKLTSFYALMCWHENSRVERASIWIIS